jgi:multiple sugar transport system permease protein
MRRSTFWTVLALIVALVWTLLPLYWFLKFAFETDGEIAQFPPPLFPPHPQPAAFYAIFGYPYTLASGTVLPASGQADQVILGLRNSLIIAVIVTTITMIVVVPLAYVFTRLEFRHRNKLLTAVLLAASTPPVSTLIPFYALYVQLDLVGTLFGLIIIVLTITIPFITWMLMGFFRNLPPVERLARIDGFSRLYTFTRIMVPLGRGGIAVAAGIAFLFSWNEYVYAQVGVPVPKLVAIASGRHDVAHAGPAVPARLLPAKAHQRDEPDRPGSLTQTGDATGLRRDKP